MPHYHTIPTTLVLPPLHSSPLARNGQPVTGSLLKGLKTMAYELEVPLIDQIDFN
ncbi:MAG TPA: hypothetical protein VIO11_08925 [Candidatus Methanoperedens sp.]